MFDDITTGFGIAPLMQTPNPYNGGLISYDYNNRKFRITDPNTGSTCELYKTTHVIKLDQQVEEIIKWAAQKMQEEASLKNLIEQNESAKQLWNDLQLILMLSK